jgi:hypothetical protein
MMLRLLVCIALLGSTAFAGWPRVGAGSSADSPPPHPLAYFLVDPCARPESDGLVRAIQCTSPYAPSPSSAELKRRAEIHTDVVELGKVGGFTIYDLWYRRDGSFYQAGAVASADVRSVLVKTDADQYREIDVDVRIGDLFPASEIVNLDGEPILIAKSHDGGNHNRIDENLYMFRPSGLETPDFKAVGETVKKLTPPNMSLRVWTHDYATMTDLVEIYRNDLNLPPVAVQERVRISVTYRFVNGHAVVTSSKYEPYSQ